MAHILFVGAKALWKTLRVEEKLRFLCNERYVREAFQVDMPPMKARQPIGSNVSLGLKVSPYSVKSNFL